MSFNLALELKILTPQMHSLKLWKGKGGCYWPKRSLVMYGSITLAYSFLLFVFIVGLDWSTRYRFCISCGSLFRSNLQLKEIRSILESCVDSFEFSLLIFRLFFSMIILEIKQVLSLEHSYWCNHFNITANI